MNTTTTRPDGKLRIRQVRLKELMHDARIDNYSELCDRMGMTKATLSRVRNGHAQPGHRLIAELTRVLGATIDDLFEVIEDDTTHP